MYNLEQVKTLYYTHSFYIIYPTLLTFVANYFELDLDSDINDDIVYRPIDGYITHPVFGYIIA